MEDLLVESNQKLFIDVHRKIINNQKEKLILINCGGMIVVKLEGKEIYRAEDYRPKLYHRLKEICHLYVATYFQTINPDEEKKKQLISVLKQLLDQFDELGIPSELFPSQIGIVGFCLKILVENVPFESVSKNVIGFINKNIDYATKLQLDTLHDIIQEIKKKVTLSECSTELTETSSLWNNVKVIVMGRPVHRLGDTSMQYFGRLTGKKHEELSGFFSSGWLPTEDEIMRKASRGLIYAENISTIEQAESLLSEHTVAGKLGNDIFGNQLRLQYDLLAETASKYLKSKCHH